jgi:hypothetical protein
VQQTVKNAAVGFDTQASSNRDRHRIHELTAIEYPMLVGIFRLIDKQPPRLHDVDRHFGLFCRELQCCCTLHNRPWQVSQLIAVVHAGNAWTMDQHPSRRLSSTTTPPQHSPAEYSANPEDAAIYRLFNKKRARRTAASRSRRPQSDPDVSNPGSLHYPEHGALVGSPLRKVFAQSRSDDEWIQLHRCRTVAKRRVPRPSSALAHARSDVALELRFTSCQRQALGGS